MTLLYTDQHLLAQSHMHRFISSIPIYFFLTPVSMESRTD